MLFCVFLCQSVLCRLCQIALFKLVSSYCIRNWFVLFSFLLILSWYIHYKSMIYIHVHVCTYCTKIHCLRYHQVVFITFRLTLPHLASSLRAAIKKIFFKLRRFYLILKFDLQAALLEIFIKCLISRKCKFLNVFQLISVSQILAFVTPDCIFLF